MSRGSSGWRGAAGDLRAVGAAAGRLVWGIVSAVTGWTVQLLGLVFLAGVAVALLFRVLN